MMRHFEAPVHTEEAVPMEEFAFGGRLPETNGVSTPNPHALYPSEGWTMLREGTAQALPAFAAYKSLDCQHNVLQSD